MPYRLSPGQLAKASLLTSGAMTNRIDRLEQKGLIVREAHPKDRRGVLVRLTPAGRKLIREVVEARFTEASRWGEALSGRERQTLKRLLRKLLITRPSRNVVFSEIDAAEKSTA
jgi:DNA-binding MarR family transcriptional regulator